MTGYVLSKAQANAKKIGPSLITSSVDHVVWIIGRAYKIVEKLESSGNPAMAPSKGAETSEVSHKLDLFEDMLKRIGGS